MTAHHSTKVHTTILICTIVTTYATFCLVLTNTVSIVLFACRQGEGKYHFVDGGVYDGNWSADKESGSGTAYLPTRSLLHAFHCISCLSQCHFDTGKRFYANGDYHDGLWAYGNREGMGVFMTAAGDKVLCRICVASNVLVECMA